MTKYFGQFGGQYVGEVLKPALLELEKAVADILPSKDFQQEFGEMLTNYAGRPTPLYYAKNTTEDLNGAKVYIKLEGLANTGAHKINNALGQALLAKKMGKTRVIAETGAGQHGVATAAAAAKLGLDCEVFMGEVDIRRQQPNVFLMKQYGATVTPVSEGTRTLKDAVNRTLKEWSTCAKDTFYVLGSALGPYPYPDMVREFQSVIGKEIREHILEREGRLPDVLIACCGGGSNAIGTFSAFFNDEAVDMIAVEAGGSGDSPGQHAARMNGGGRPGIIEGYKSFFLQDSDGQVLPTHSISAGLDYAGIGPQLALMGSSGRIHFEKAYDHEVLSAYQYFAKKEGLLFALESAHAAAHALKVIPLLKDKILVLTMSGRGDKDIFITAKELYTEEWKKFLRSESEE